MQQENDIRSQMVKYRNKMNVESDPLFRQVYKDRADTLEWVLGA